jgi:hypothetical protein
MERKPDLTEMILAMGFASPFSCSLDGGQEQRNQDPDDRNHDQKLDQRKCLAMESHERPRSDRERNRRYRAKPYPTGKQPSIKLFGSGTAVNARLSKAAYVGVLIP